MIGSTTNVSDGASGLVDKDWYKVSLQKGELYTFSGTSISVSTDSNAISLYGQNGTQVHAVTEGPNPSIVVDTTYQLNDTETYYLAVSAGGPEPLWRTATGDYSVSVSSQPSATVDII